MDSPSTKWEPFRNTVSTAGTSQALLESGNPLREGKMPS